MNDYRIRHVSLVAARTVAQNVDLLTSDFQTKREGTLVRIAIAAAAAGAIELVPNTGANIKLQASNLSAGVLHVFEIALDPARTWNVATPDGDGLTVNMLLVDEVDA